MVQPTINLFQATDSEIKALKPALAFYLAPDERGLRLKFFRKNLAFKFIKKHPAIHYLKKERLYYFPAQEINKLIKSLKGKKTTFAVHESAGKRLSISAETRRKICSLELTPANQDLEFSLLYPCIVTSQGNKIEVRGQTDKFFKQNKYINLVELKNLIYNSYFEQIHYWISSEVICLLPEDNYFEDHFDDSLLSLSFPEISFCCDKKQRPYLQVRNDIDFSLDRDNYLEVVNPVTLEGAKFYSLNLSELERVLKKVEDRFGTSILKSANFKTVLEKSKQLKGNLTRANYYNALKDLEIDHPNQDLIKKLFPHQRVAVSWLLENNFGLFADDMGLGKTLSILTSYDYLRKKSEFDFILVISPNSLVKNWQRESKLWFGDMKLLDLPKTKASREDFFNKFKLAPKDWIAGLVLNFESLRTESTLEQIYNILAAKKFLLVIDESQRAKNPKSKTFAALKKISTLAQRRFLLSGTPTPRDFADIWSQVYLADQGERFGKSFYTWLESIAELGNKWSPFAVKRYKKDELEDAVLRVQEILLRRKKEDVISLPEKIFSVRDIELTGDQLKQFDGLCKDLIVKISKLSGALFYKQIDSVLEQMLRAVQIASNPRLVDENWKGEPAKFLELDILVEEIVEENSNKLVIWTNYLANVRELMLRYSRLKPLAYSGEVSEKDRDLNIQRFQNDAEYKILIAVPAAGGVGITLTAAQTAVYLEKTWNAEHWMQSVDRIHRIGQNGTVNIISLHSCFLDEIIYKNLQKKQRMQSIVMGDYQDNLPTKEELIAALKLKNSST